MSVSTPCVGVCRLDARGICVGCGRTIEQIVAWKGMAEAERQQIMATLPTDCITVSRAESQPADPIGGREQLRIVSLLPAATEMAFALGLGDQVVGVSHECDFPSTARNRPAVVRPALALEQLSPREIDTAVSQRLATGNSLYEIDEELLRQLRAFLILTQDLCQVCAPSGKELSAALSSLTTQPSVLSMTPHTLMRDEVNLN